VVSIVDGNPLQDAKALKGPWMNGKLERVMDVFLYQKYLNQWNQGPGGLDSDWIPENEKGFGFLGLSKMNRKPPGPKPPIKPLVDTLPETNSQRLRK